MMDLISVIVPVYNVEKYLLRCVDSILQQTYTDLEIILVDDESPDRCPQMCDELSRKESRIKVVHRKNGGLGYARNSGLEQATGKYVTFIDSDDWIDKQHIEHLHQAIDSYDADVAFGTYTRAGSDGGLTPSTVTLKKKVYENEQITQDIILPLVGADVTSKGDVELESSCCMNLYRMDVIVDNQLRFISEKQAIAEDQFFNLDYLNHARRVVVTDERGYYYFENMDSISRKYDPRRFQRTLVYYELLTERLTAYGLSEKAGLRRDRNFLMKIRVAIRLVVQSKMTRSVKFSTVKTMLQDETVQKVLQQYPIEAYGAGMKLLTSFMHRRFVAGVYGLIWLREVKRKLGSRKK